VTGVVSRGTVLIADERCKGCELCIPACRPGVLWMSSETNQMGFRLPRLVPGCTGCMACAEVCPDFVFEVWKYDHPVVEERAGEASSGGASSGGASSGGDSP
jgi:2-oxoglutarate ferredoxin oxidoreductase subunit delta